MVPAPASAHVIARWLGYGGLLPFVVPALLVALLPAGEWQTLAARVLLAYGAVILSFLGGIVWGLSLRHPSLTPSLAAREFIYSVCPSLLGWVALLLPLRAGAALLAASVCAAFVHDALVARLHELPRWFLSLRLQLSLGAVSALSLAAIFGPR